MLIVASNDAAVGRATLAKVTLRLIPFVFVLYIIAFLDRVNVGFAALQMNEDLGFSDAVYGFGAGIFFIEYFIFEVPSNRRDRRHIFAHAGWHPDRHDGGGGREVPHHADEWVGEEELDAAARL